MGSCPDEKLTSPGITSTRTSDVGRRCHVRSSPVPLVQAFRKDKVADRMVMLLTLLACRTWHPLQVAAGSPNGGPSDPTLESCQRNAGQTSIDRGRKNHKRILDIGRDPSISAFPSDYRRRHNNPSFCHVGENA